MKKERPKRSEAFYNSCMNCQRILSRTMTGDKKVTGGEKESGRKVTREGMEGLIRRL